MSSEASQSRPVVVVIGVSGCGKSTVGRLLAERLGCAFEEGDDLHPAANLVKMRAGQSLTDSDRWPWLDRVAGWIDDRASAEECGVITCSALKRSYRDRLARQGVVFVYLAADRATLQRRLAGRPGHFMPAGLLDSQLETLEEPGRDEAVIRLEVDDSPDVLVDRAAGALIGSR